jgi:transcriptional regulator with XRE-family HTH domain
MLKERGVCMLSERLKKLRKRDDLTQQKLAETIGYSQQTVAKWESGTATPDPDTILSLARVFNVPTDYLLGHKNDTKRPYEENFLRELHFLVHTEDWGELERRDVSTVSLKLYLYKAEAYPLYLEDACVIADKFSKSVDEMAGRVTATEIINIPLANDEKELLDCYKSLNKQGKEYIRQTMQMAVTQYKKDFDLSDVDASG